jgi:predicted ester cyclase
MKHIIILLAGLNKNRLVYGYPFAIILSLLVGCSGKGPDNKKVALGPSYAAVALRESEESENNKALVLKMYEEFDKGRLPNFAHNISSGFKCNVLGNTDLDWEGFIQFGNGFLTAFPDGKHNFNYIVVDGENVVTIGTYTGTHLNEMQGILPTKAKIELSVMHIDRVVNGKIVEHRGIANQVQLMNQLGFKMVPEK